MGEGGTGKAVFDYLTNGQLQWQKMPDPFEKFVYPDFTFEVYGDPKRFQADLVQRFPQEEKGIRQYFRDVRKAAFWFGAHAMSDLFPRGLRPLFKPTVRCLGAIARQTTQQYLDQHFQDPRLKALLVSQWADYGLPPSQSCFGIHSLIVCHYLQGGWYPVGGAKAIAQSIIPLITAAGGSVLTQRRVTQILLKSGTAVGVEVQNTAPPTADLEAYYAPIVVSDAGVLNTYLKLIPADYPLPIRPSIQAFPPGSTVLTVYLGFKQNPQCLGFQGENHWIYTSYDHEQIAQASLLTPDPRPQFCYLSFPSLKDPVAAEHTAEIIAPVDYKVFAQWSEQPWRHRDREYNDLKTLIMHSLIQLVEDRYPGFQALIEYAELSTPLTVEHFDGSDRGAIYGIPCVPERLDQDWIGARTPIKNLYLTGADALSPGIMGAMMGGVKTAGLLHGPWGFFQIMATMMNAASLANRSEGSISR
jgi:phytoene dehydrogenase-like protein